MKLTQSQQGQADLQVQDGLNGKRNASKSRPECGWNFEKQRGRRMRKEFSGIFYWNDRRKHKKIETISFCKNERTEHFIFEPYSGLYIDLCNARKFVHGLFDSGMPANMSVENKI